MTALPVQDCCLYYISRVECMADFISGRNVNLLSDDFITFVLLAHESLYSYGLSHLESCSVTKFQPPTKQTLCSGPFVFTLSQQCSDLFSPRTQRHAYLKSVQPPPPLLYPVTVMICKGGHRGSTWPGPEWDENGTSIRTSDGNQKSAQGPWSVPVLGPDYLMMGAVYRSVLNLLSCLQTRLICIKHV